MKQVLLMLAISAICTSGAAMAQASTYAPNAQVQQVCGVYSATGTAIDLNFGALADVATTATVSVSAGTATYRCYGRTGFTRMITSQNNGYLTLDGDVTTDNARRIRFDLRHGGGSGRGFPT